MKKLILTFALLLSAIRSPAAPVIFNTQEITGQALNNPITVTAKLKIFTGNGMIIANGSPLVLQPVNGTVTTNLMAGIYNCTIQGVSSGFVINVLDNTTNVEDARNITISGLTTFSTANLQALLTQIFTNNYVAGSNFAFTTNTVAGVTQVTINIAPNPQGTNWSFFGTNNFAGTLSFMSGSTLAIGSNMPISFSTNAGLLFNFAGPEAVFPPGGFIQAANANFDPAGGEFFFNAGSDIAAANGANVVRGFEATNIAAFFASAATGALAAAYGTAAKSNANAFLQSGNNLSDAGNFARSRDNLSAQPQSTSVGSSFFSSWDYAGVIYTTSQAYETFNGHCGTILKRGGKIYMFYGVNTANDATDKGFIAYISGTNFSSLQPGGIVLTNSTSGWDSNHVQGPRMFTENGTNYMFYFGSTNAGFEAIPHSIGVAYQADTTNWSPTAWTKYSGNPLLTPGANTYDSLNCWRPFVIRNGPTYYLFYNGTGAGGKERISFATASNVLGPYTKYSGNPVIDVQAPDAYAQDPAIMRLPDGNYAMTYTLCCQNEQTISTAWSHDLTNWTVMGQVPINGYNGPQTQSADLFDDNGPCILWDAYPNFYVANLSRGIDGRRITLSSSNILATNITATAVNATNLVATSVFAANASVGSLFASSLSVAYKITNAITPLLWLKADAITNGLAGQNLTNWYDSSGNGLSTSVPGGNAWPTYNIGANGLPYVQWGGSGSLRTSSTTLGTNLSVICVISRAWTSPNYAPIFSQAYSSGPGIGLITMGGTGGDWLSKDISFFGNGYNSGNAPRALGLYGSLIDNQVVVISGVLSAGIARVWVNGTAVSTVESAATVPTTTGPIEIGSAISAGNYWDGKIFEIMVIPSALSDAARQKGEVYMASRWGIGSSISPTNAYATIFGIFPISAGDVVGNLTSASFGGVLTNNGTIWLSTNNTPTSALPNGSVATVTDGRFFVRSNATWVLH